MIEYIAENSIVYGHIHCKSSCGGYIVSKIAQAHSTNTDNPPYAPIKIIHNNMIIK